MPPALAYAPEPEADLLAAFAANRPARAARGQPGRAARSFLRRWPDPQAWADEPLAVRLAAAATRSFLMFLLLGGHLRPGYDYLMRRKLTSFWRELPHGPMPTDLTGSSPPPAELGFTERTRRGVGSQVIGRVLIQTGRRLAADRQPISMNCWPPARPSGATVPSRHYSARCTPPGRCCSTSACSQRRR